MKKAALNNLAQEAQVTMSGEAGYAPAGRYVQRNLAKSSPFKGKEPIMDKVAQLIEGLRKLSEKQKSPSMLPVAVVGGSALGAGVGAAGGYVGARREQKAGLKKLKKVPQGKGMLKKMLRTKVLTTHALRAAGQAAKAGALVGAGLGAASYFMGKRMKKAAVEDFDIKRRTAAGSAAKGAIIGAQTGAVLGYLGSETMSKALAQKGVVHGGVLPVAKKVLPRAIARGALLGAGVGALARAVRGPYKIEKKKEK